MFCICLNYILLWFNNDLAMYNIYIYIKIWSKLTDFDLSGNSTYTYTKRKKICECLHSGEMCKSNGLVLVGVY